MTDIAEVPVDRERWWEHGACRGMPSRFFFPERGDSVRQAKEVCRSCPVISECLNDGLMVKYGLWGGLTEKERRVVRRERGLREDDAA